MGKKGTRPIKNAAQARGTVDQGKNMKPKSSRSKLVKVRSDSLKIHPVAQREIVPSNLKRLIAGLDLDAIGVLHAVEYPIHGDSGPWVIDGQHRIRAILEHGFGEWQVEVKIHLDIQDDKAACDKFLKLNKRAAVSPYDTFLNELKGHYPDACGADAVVRKNGLQISRGAGDGKLVCVSSLKKLYRADQGKSLDLALRAIMSSWGSRSAALEGKIVDGVGLVFGRHDGSIDEPSMVKKLAKYPGGPSGLVGDARGILTHRKTTLSRCVAELVIESYNSGRRTNKLDPV